MELFSAHQVDATTWELRAGDKVVASFTDHPQRSAYAQVVGHLSTMLQTMEEENSGAAAGDGLLPDVWMSDEGIAFSEMLDGGRDFTKCSWSWRDPSKTLVALMLMTETSMGGHLGAELAGFVEQFTLTDGTVHVPRGRFYDNEAGITFRDLLLDGRRFGVSVDPTEAVDWEDELICDEMDDYGYCISGQWITHFLAYEIGGLTGCPIPGFERASIVLDTAADPNASATPPVRASLSVPLSPPRDWFELPEPQLGEPFLDGLGDDVLVEQLDAAGNVVAHAVPMTIRDDGLIFGHLTYWGQCHIGDPWGRGTCASASRSTNGYRDFLCGSTVCADGHSIATGVFTVGCEHSSAFDVRGVQDHMAHAGMGFADVRVVDGEHGPWFCGSLKPSVTESQVRLLRSLSPSGEWVRDLAAVLAVNASGLPVQRIAASAFPGVAIPAVALRSSGRHGELTKLIAGNVVRRCPECERRAAEAGRRGERGRGEIGALESRLAQVMDVVTTLEQRTRHLVPAEAEARRAELVAQP